MKGPSSFAAVCLVAALVITTMMMSGSSAAMVAEDQTCNPMDLQPCAAALTSGSAPTAECCSRLKSQRPCLCTYLKDPKLRPYTAHAREVAAACHLAVPSC